MNAELAKQKQRWMPWQQLQRCGNCQHFQPEREFRHLVAADAVYPVIVYIGMDWLNESGGEWLEGRVELQMMFFQPLLGLQEDTCGKGGFITHEQDRCFDWRRDDGR